MEQTRLSGVCESSDSRRPTWLPLLGWLPLALAINSIFWQGPIAYWGRWLGLLVWIGYGFLTLVTSRQWRLREFDGLAIWVFLLIVISTFWAGEHLSSNHSLTAVDFRQTALIKACSLFLGYLTLTWGLESLLISLQTVVQVINKFVIAVTLLLAVGLLGNLMGAIPWIAGAGAGLFVNPNTTTALALVTLPLAIWFYVQHPGLMGVWPSLTLVTALVLAQARSTVMVCGLLVFFYLVCWPGLRRLRLANLLFPLGLMLLGLVLFLSIDFWGTNLADSLVHGLRPNFDNAQRPGLSSYRLNLLWPVFIQGIAASPGTFLIGHGWGSEEALMLFQADQSRFFAALNLISAHSAYLGLTYQIGLVGGVSVFGPLWAMVLRQMLTPLPEIITPYFQLKVSLVGVVLAALGVCVFESGFYNLGAIYMLPSWIAIYLVTRLDQLPGQSEERSPI
ncbi:O-antigen ligase family protein [Adonisia turfae]|uniref:Uncharacterized protein n=1 Tax=Adonisia turfae CCMR0081 TaxID=2292702 RepID=A0A6M0RX99_9CYAN|nr:O-antigen ligase family protein [Adonisia turfae]NEZ60857.1 hypothetical protein [Adonisia turfae CCMR0081]